MPINALIPLSGKPVELGQSVRQGGVARNVIDTNIENQQTKDTRIKAGEAAARKAETDANSAENRAKLERIVIDAATIKPMLESGNTQGALKALQERRAAILERGGDTRETDGLIAQVSSGDPAALQEIVDDAGKAILMGEQFGILKPQTRTPGYTNIATGEDGRKYGLNPETRRFEPIDSGGMTFKSGAPQTNITVEAEGEGLTEEQKALGKGRVARYEKIQEAADNAIDQDEQLAQLENIDITTGFGHETRAALAGAINSVFGQGTGDDLLNTSATAMQAFRAVSKRLQATELNKAKGPQTEGDAKRIMDTLANMGNEAEANRFLIKSLRATNARKQEQAQFYESVLERDGSLKNADKEWSAFKRSTPMVSDAVRDGDTGLPMFYSEFVAKAKERNPQATSEQIINAWRELQ